jgi:hypothetical protein
MSRLFGGVMQNGYVVRDIEAAMRHWIDVLGVGPWFYIDHLPVADFQYKGQPWHWFRLMSYAHEQYVWTLRL